MDDDIRSTASSRETDVAMRMQAIRDGVRDRRVDLPPRVEPSSSGRSSIAGSMPPNRPADGLGIMRNSLRAGQSGGRAGAELATLYRRTRDLGRRTGFKEFEFPSTVPVFARVISLFRRMWNGASTRWYVRHALQQQTDLNTALINTLSDVVLALARQNELTERMQAEIRELRAELEEVQRAPQGRDEEPGILNEKVDGQER